MQKVFHFESIYNLRDLGGYPTRYGESSYGAIFRSGSLGYATEKDVDQLADIGIKTVIDLRDDASKENHPDKTVGDPRFAYISLPVNGNGRVPTSRQDMVESYLEMLEDPYSARKVFQAIMHADKPCVFHCNAGKDRTGSFTMVLLLLNGVPFEVINMDYMASFPLLEEMTKNTLIKNPDFPVAVLTPDIKFLRDVEALFLKRYGSAEDYCEAIGLSEDEVNLLSNILGKQEKSCGAVVFHQGKVLVEHMNAGHYSIPKGHVEPSDKDEEDTARREIKEETGLPITFLKGFRKSIDYSPKEGVVKQVVFFAADTTSERVTPQPEEVSSIHWVSPADAMRILSHDSDRQIVKEASLWRYEEKSK